MKTAVRDLTDYPPNIRKPRLWLLIIPILLLAGGLYLYDLGAESLWIDELISVDRAKPNYLNILRVRPLYYLILHVWMKFSSSDAWLRGLNVLFSFGSILLIYRLSRCLTGETVGLLSTLIFTLAPLVIHHTQEVRMYIPSVFFGLLGSLILVCALDNPKFSWISLWVLLRWLAILTTPLNLLLLLPDAVLFFWKFRQRPQILYRFGIGLILIGVLWLPWLIEVAVNSITFMNGGEAPEAVADVVESPINRPGLLSGILQFGRFTAWPFGRPISDKINGFYKVYSLLIACLLSFSVFIGIRRSSRLIWISAWAFLPLIPLFLVSQISRSLWVDRYLLFTAPYIFILLAASLVEIWRRQRWGAVAIALIYAVAVSGGIKRYYAVPDREDWRGLVAEISDNEKPGDVIVWSMDQSVPRALNHYYHGSADIQVIESGHEHKSDAEDERLAVERWLSNLPKGRSRIWLAYSETSPVFLSVLEEQFKVERHQTFPDTLDVFLLTPQSF